MMDALKYLSRYPEHLQQSVATLIHEERLDQYLLGKYPQGHQIKTDQALRDVVMTFKNRYIRKSGPISKVVYDPKLHVVKNALGTHSYVSRVQGQKLKSKNEIRVSALFKQAPVEFLEMIVVHELAHVKEKEHNKAFYQLCCHMLPDYHQVEFDVRVYLTYQELTGKSLY
ncbi:M48 family metallopeptidase [Reinekea sp. G2M2-21]|uniref:M48 metallopeptidase family protein n=1 Tax=Reinekea sp. G2M2-21 TaxID=2788942 RepID=UPI0018AAA45B